MPGGSANPIAVISGNGTASPEANSHAQPSEGGEKNSAEAENISPGQGIMIDTGTKIVNLAEPGGKKFIRVTATLEFAPPAGYHSLPAEEQGAELAAFMSEINAKVPVLDDTIVTLLSSKDFQSVYTTEGKDILRQEIMEAVNTRLPDYKVIYVYFKEFVMQ
jgi:flagellar FliL protein